MNTKQALKAAKREQRRRAGEFLAPDWVTPRGWKESGANKITVRRDGDYFVAYQKGKIQGAYHVGCESSLIQSGAARIAATMKGKIKFYIGSKGDVVFRNVKECRRCKGTGQFNDKGNCYTCKGKGESQGRVVNILPVADLLAQNSNTLPSVRVEESKHVTHLMVRNAIRRQINYDAWQKTNPRAQFEKEKQRKQELVAVWAFCHLPFVHAIMNPPALKTEAAAAA
jgi:hypothetical protein